MPRLFFVRHGETDWNRQGKLQGHTDIAMNALGKRQAASLAPLAESLGFDHVFSSDLQRARQTAELSLPKTAVITTTPALREINLGDAEGLTRAEIDDKWGPEPFQNWAKPDWASYDNRFANGESRREGMDRLLYFLNSNLPSGAGMKIAFYTHGLLLRTFAHWSAGLETRVFTTPNCCVYEWDWVVPRPLSFTSPFAERPKLRQIYNLNDESLSLA